MVRLLHQLSIVFIRASFVRHSSSSSLSDGLVLVLSKAGEPEDEAATGACVCNGALGPAKLNPDVADLWWHEIHWVRKSERWLRG